ncbi:MAG: NAD(P)-dependent oxidoreductase, partial [Myxococcales bacterium]
GEEVRVWNRSADRARALAEVGAVACDDPAGAVRGAKRVHVTLSDDAAVDEVLERASAGFEPDVQVIDHTTTSPAGTGERAARWQQRGVAFLHAPVFMGPQNARERTGTMLCSGDSWRFAQVKTALEGMTGKVVYLGPDPARAAAFKLMGNLFLMSVSAGLADTLTLGKALGIPAAEAATVFDVFNPAAALPARIQRVLGADFASPSWELSMARKDARLMLEAAAAGDAALAALPGIAARMDDLIERGHAHDDWMVIAKDAL